MDILVNGTLKNLMAKNESGEECTSELLHDYGYDATELSDADYDHLVSICAKYNAIVDLTSKLAKYNYDALMQYYTVTFGCKYGMCDGCGLECELDLRLQWLHEHLQTDENKFDVAELETIII